MYFVLPEGLQLSHKTYCRQAPFFYGGENFLLKQFFHSDVPT